MDSCIYFNIKASTVLEVTREDSSAIRNLNNGSGEGCWGNVSVAESLFFGMGHTCYSLRIYSLKVVGSRTLKFFK